MSRFRCQIFAAFLSLCSSAGCLLYTDTFNVPPRVDLIAPDQMLKGKAATFSVRAQDDSQRAEDLGVLWYVREGGLCPEKVAQAQALSREAGVMQVGAQPTLELIRQQFGRFCIWVLVTDRAGAVALAWKPFEVTNQPPNAALELLAPTPLRRVGSTAYLPLYSDVRISADASVDPEAEALEFRWNITGRSGERIAPAPCSAGTPNQLCHRFDAAGDYRFELRTWDGEKMSAAAELPLLVMADAPPCIEQTEPPYQLTRVVVLATEQTNLSVVEISDDGDAFPALPGQTPRTSFIWRYRYVGTPDFTRRAVTDVPSLSFAPDAYRPGDELEVRLDVLDRVTDRDFGVCEGQPECKIDPDRECRQRVTWRVRYL